ncbi:MAG: hypothetical protein CMH64_00080 [Nanoarchaeota archaeon]|nr:hypothetical protein [Nanoarchaeota archaeon]|tara:strand:- start:137 stop:472 length:336 start_codon:yes stop_codon:yes gene_type:complete
MKYFLLLFSLFLLNGCVQTPIGCTEDARVCDDGSVVVRVAPECEFQECPIIEKHFCDERKDVCNEIYQPVCGWSNENIKCIRWPCASDYTNGCFACQNEDVAYWTEGVCPG